MRNYIRNNTTFQAYIDNLKTGISFHMTIKEISAETGYTTGNLIEWYEITELGGLNFRFEYRSHRIIKSKLETRVFHFKYVNNELCFRRNTKNLPKNISSIINNHIPALKIRIPNFFEYHTHAGVSISFRKGVWSPNRMQLISKNNPYDNYDGVSELIKNSCNSPRTRQLFSLFGKKITKEMMYSEFDELLTEMTEKYLKSYYSDIKIAPEILKIIHSNGWVLIGLDDIEELIELHIMDITDLDDNNLYFRKNNLCFAITNRYDEPNINHTVGNLKPTLFTSEVYDLIDLIFTDKKVSRPVVINGFATTVFTLPVTINLNELNGN